MAIIENVHYEKKDGKLVATEEYSDGSIRRIKIKNGITDYILLGVGKQ